ncbi:hypothetical protein OAJ02_07670, partial [Nitrosopumilus sp.]|nr:hypothetical protein [Nitrosopumilus sp.]
MKKFRDFESARKFVRKLGLKSYSDWKIYCKSGNKPNDIPVAVWNIYKNKGWLGFGDFLGTGNVAPQNKQFLIFNDARKFARELKLKSRKEWEIYCKSGKRPDNIPNSPLNSYKNSGWVGWGDFLGTGNIAPSNIQYLQFQEAKKFVRSLKFQSSNEWRKYCKSGDKPEDIPSNPQQVFKNKGWINWGDWLGTGNIANYNKTYRSFNEAREFVRSLGLKTGKEWQEYCKLGEKPDDIPGNPNRHYKKEWIGIGDWLGTGNIANRNRVYLPFNEARKFVRSLKLKGDKDWRKYCKSGNKPHNIPNHANEIYKNDGYVDLGDWLGTGNIANYKKQWQNFSTAKKFVKKLRFTSRKDWIEYCKSGNKPHNIPSYPEQTYKNEWRGYDDWLKLQRIPPQYVDFRSFEKAKKFVRKLGLKSLKEWKEYCKSDNKPDDIPSSPWSSYKNTGYLNLSDFLDNGKTRNYRLFEDAKLFVKKIGLTSQNEWNVYCKSGKKPIDIPNAPAYAYKNKGWTTWGDFLGTGRIATQDVNYCSFYDAKKFVKKLEFKSRKEWEKYYKLGKVPKNIPRNADRTYKNKGWTTWGDFLGTGWVQTQKRK